MRLFLVAACVFLGSLVLPAACVAQQPPAQNPAQQESAPLAATPISELDIDVFAAKLAKEITKRHFSKVAVFGAMGPADELTILSPMIGDALSAALARHAKGFQVIERSAIRERLKQERISDSMLLTGTLADWVSQLMGAQGLIFVDFGFFDPPKITVTASLFDIRHEEEKATSTAKFSFVPDALQNDAASRPLYSDRTVRDEYNRIVDAWKRVSDNSQATHANCIYCPRPEYSQEARKAQLQGENWLLVTVTPEGRATDIAVVRPIGRSLDQQSIETIKGWKFKPATDGDGKAISERIPVEVHFQLY